MLSRLIASALGARLGGVSRARAVDPGARAAEAMRAFPPMRPLEPPPAQNDDVLQPFHEAVERDLRARGYLR